MSAKTVETLKARLAEAEAGIVGKIAARMGWVHMASVDELVTFVEEWTALHREALSEAATAERQRLAGLTSEQDEDLVRDVADASAEIIHACEWGTTPDRKALETAKSLLLATLSARRVEAMEAAAKVCDDLAFLWHIEARQADVAQYANEFMVKVVALQVAADKIRALIPPAEGPQGVEP